MNKMFALLVVAFALFLSGCGNIKKSDSLTLDSASYNYRIVEIEGMTCILLESGYRGALTCNWDEYKGE